jgi:hypothetical protein
VVLTAVWAVGLIAKPGASRLLRTAFATACSGLAVCFWIAAWLASAPASRLHALGLAVHIGLGVVSIGAMVAIWWAWARSGHERGPSWLAILATVLIVAVFSVLFLPVSEALNLLWWGILLCVAGVTAVAAIVPRLVSIARLPAEERPSYLGILRGGLAVCLAWILVLQFASLVWLGAWRVRAAHEIERAYATSENQAVLKIMGETHHEPETQ